MAYVYRHIRLDINQPFYIGIGENGRAYSSRDRNVNWHNIVNVTDYEVEILMDGLTREEAFKKEREFIKLYGRKDNGTGILCNKTNGGNGQSGWKISEETRKKMGKSQLGNKKYLLRTTPQEEINKKVSQANKGRKRTEEAIQKMRDYYKTHEHPNKGKKMCEEGRMKVIATRKRKPIIQYDLEGNFIREWSSKKEANRNGYSEFSVWKCCNRIEEKYKNSIWKYKN